MKVNLLSELHGESNHTIVRSTLTLSLWDQICNMQNTVDKVVDGIKRENLPEPSSLLFKCGVKDPSNLVALLAVAKQIYEENGISRSSSIELFSKKKCSFLDKMKQIDSIKYSEIPSSTPKSLSSSCGDKIVDFVIENLNLIRIPRLVRVESSQDTQKNGSHILFRICHLFAKKISKSM